MKKNVKIFSFFTIRYNLRSPGNTPRTTSETIYLNHKKMNTVFYKLQSICEPVLRDEKIDQEQFNIDFQKEAALTEQKITGHILSIDNETQMKAFFNFAMDELSRICDQLFEHLKHDSSDVNILFLMDTMANLRRKYSSKVNSDTKFPLAFRKIYGQRYLNEWENIKSSWAEFGLSERTLKAAAYPFQEFEDSFEEMTWFHFTWINRYMQHLRNMNFSNNYQIQYGLAELLIRMDFNLPAFNVYCTRQITGYLDTLQSKEEQLFMMDRIRKEISQLSSLSKDAFYNFASSSKDFLLSWLDKEESFRARHDLQTSKAFASSENPHKFKFKTWTVRQIAYFFKQLADENILSYDKIKELSEQISYNCCSANETHFQPRTVASKLYSSEPDEVEPIIAFVDDQYEAMKPSFEFFSKLKTFLDPYRKKEIK